MKCIEVQENLSAYIYGELDVSQVKEIHKHLSICDNCLKLEMQLRKPTRLMNQIKPDILPEDFGEKLQEKLQREKRKKFIIPQKSRKVVLAIAATLLLTLAIEFIVRDAFFSRSLTENLSNYEMTASVFGSKSQADYPSLFQMLKNNIN
jgi:anti-sigma factor RsiW